MLKKTDDLVPRGVPNIPSDPCSKPQSPGQKPKFCVVVIVIKQAGIVQIMHSSPQTDKPHEVHFKNCVQHIQETLVTSIALILFKRLKVTLVISVASRD